MNDIVSGNGVALGPGWGRLETHRGESFRWVSNDAILYVAMLRNVDHQVQLQIEPGPGVGLKPFKLNVLDADDGKQVADVAVKGRHTVSFTIPGGEPRIHTLKMRTDDGGKSSPGDARVLNFRLFRIVVNLLPGDVLPPRVGYRLGIGWYPLETFGGESFRWVNNDAQIEVTSAATAPLALEIEPGPGFELGPFRLHVYDSANSPIASFDVKKRERVTFAVPPGVKLPTFIRLHVEGGGKTTSQDKRVMNFRVFEHTPMLEAASASDAPTTAPKAPAAAATGAPAS